MDGPEPNLTMFDAVDHLDMHWPRHGMLSCPKHSDSSPSLKLHQDWWYCFSCHRTGDAYGLIALYQDRDVADVLRELVGGDRMMMRSSATQGLRKDTAHRVRIEWMRVMDSVFGMLHMVLGDLPTDTLLDQIERMGDRADTLKEEIDPLHARAAVKRMTEWELEQLEWLAAEGERIDGYVADDAARWLEWRRTGGTDGR